MNRRKKLRPDAHDGLATPMTNQSDERPVLRADLLNPGRLLQEMIASYRPLAEQKGVRFEAPSYLDWHDVVVDAPKVRRIVAMLLDNAVTHTSAGSVRLEFHPPAGEHWGVVIEDTGSGMAAVDTASVVEKSRLNAADAALSTEGDRLSNCKELVGRMRGTISVHSQPSKGTRVEVKLPVMMPHLL